MGAGSTQKRRVERRWRPAESLGRAGAYVDLALQFSLAILIGAFGGRWLDGRLGCSPAFLLAGTMLGAAAGFVGLYRGVMPRRGAEGDRRRPGTDGVASGRADGPQRRQETAPRGDDSPH